MSRETTMAEEWLKLATLVDTPFDLRAAYAAIANAYATLAIAKKLEEEL